jgi:hypothetical protein
MDTRHNVGGGMETGTAGSLGKSVLSIAHSSPWIDNRLSFTDSSEWSHQISQNAFHGRVRGIMYVNGMSTDSGH